MLSAEELKVSHSFHPRGPGLNQLPCFICGHNPVTGVQTDMASFIDSSLITFPFKNAGIVNPATGKPFVAHPVDNLFQHHRLIGKIDYRDFESNRVQYKIGACGEHEPNLMALCYGALLNKDNLTSGLLLDCIPKRKIP